MIRNEIKGNFKEAKSYVNIKESWSLLCDFTRNYFYFNIVFQINNYLFNINSML